ncbi:FMN-binding negative transcriptional regulator [Nocardioides sp. AE5]|uniref:FMN-binding negative transcriptional regulator n=1 Tax=Nocardioides sp. AE5 TaxID=2962573 RepID=UPI00288148FB|nr:FMN-binding negative transcriptional regulator [Nocardioides sp. AE5]MDT0202471.1 FMN-binding negative transcriptional regulator [Nocardioides sp. AE5]
MYTPRFNRMDEAELRPFVEQVGAAEFITAGGDGYPLATRLPIVWHQDRLIFHMALANPHWKQIADGMPALAVVGGPEAYITPEWYAGKAEHGRVVPTWNYSAVQFRGRATVRRDPEWLHHAVTVLTDLNEQRRPVPWAVTDAPETFVAQQAKAIVGIDFVIEEVAGKAKRSQNRSDEDRRSVIAGLREGDPRAAAVAEAMEHDLS